MSVPYFQCVLKNSVCLEKFSRPYRAFKYDWTDVVNFLVTEPGMGGPGALPH